jgi:AcrR family transcriptional regulator
MIDLSDRTAARPAEDRRVKRREQTRAKLIEAAETLFARQGVERTRINEITDEADVGFGSFYNHFESKDAIVAAVLSVTAAAHAEAIVSMTAGVDDPAEVIAIAHRYFVRLARLEPEWAWLVVRLEQSHDALLETLRPYAKADLERAIAEGRLDVPDVNVALFAGGGALLAVARGVLEGRLGEEADVQHAEGVLRLFGMAPAEAADVASRPLPNLRA